MDARIWLTGAGGEPRSAALPPGRTVVGRDPEAAIHVDDEAVSWNHLEIENRGGIDAGSDVIWVANGSDDSVRRIGLVSAEPVGGPVAVGADPGAVVVGEEAPSG